MGDGKTISTVCEGQCALLTQIGWAGFYFDFWGYNEVGTPKDRERDRKGTLSSPNPKSLMCYYAEGG